MVEWEAVGNSELRAKHARLRAAAEVFGLASYPARLEILLRLAQEKKPVRVADLAKQASIGGSTFSAHSASLFAAGLIERSRQGREFYCTFASNEYTKVIMRVVRMVEKGRWPRSRPRWRDRSRKVFLNRSP
jgi:DNA-binding transcriptional ArsR family regulator